MLCSQVRKSFYSYAAGSVEGLEHYLIKEHLDSCTSCRLEYERFTDIKCILSSMGRSIEAPSGLIANIMEVIDLERYKAIGIYALNNLRSFGLSLIAAGLIMGALSLSPPYMVKYLDARLIGKSAAKIQEGIIKPFEIISDGVVNISDRISVLNEAIDIDNER